MIDMKLINNKDGEATVLMYGRLDSAASAETEKILRSLTPKYNKLTLDFAKLDYISSAGLRILKVLHVEMMKKSGSLVLKNVNQQVMEIFEMTGFSGLLTFEQ